jgi:hypothetical protein
MMAEQTSIEKRPLLKDFATIFAHMWYRDFPLQMPFRKRAQRADWTTHIGIAVRSTADLMGLFTHFESGGRTDAVLKNNKGAPLAVLEWEFAAVHRGDEIVTEFKKLKKGVEEDFQGIEFACLIGYARSGTGRFDYDQRSAMVLEDWTKRWVGELPTLLLVVINFEWTGKGRLFTNMTIDEIKEGSRSRLREQPAYPWKVIGSRWAQETLSIQGDKGQGENE